MDTDFLDREAEQLKRGHEDNMPCRQKIGIVLDHVKKRFVEGSSKEAALKDLRDSVKDLSQCKKHKGVKKVVPRRPKGGTKLRYK
jgi:hypothetical protein